MRKAYHPHEARQRLTPKGTTSHDDSDHPMIDGFELSALLLATGGISLLLGAAAGYFTACVDHPERTATMTVSHKPDDLLTLDEVAEAIGVARASVRVYHQRSRNRAASGTATETDMPAPDQRFGRVPVWRFDSIQEWDESREKRMSTRKVANA